MSRHYFRQDRPVKAAPRAARYIIHILGQRAVIEATHRQLLALLPGLAPALKGGR